MFVCWGRGGDTLHATSSDTDRHQGLHTCEEKSTFRFTKAVTMSALHDMCLQVATCMHIYDMFAGGYDKTLQLFDVTTGQVTGCVCGLTLMLCIAMSSSCVLHCNGTHFPSLESRCLLGQVVKTFTGHTSAKSGEPYSSEP